MSVASCLRQALAEDAAARSVPRRTCVCVESPFNGTPEEMDRNLRYLAWCLDDCFLRNEAPFASHCLYPLTLPEDEPGSKRGLDAGAAMRERCDMVVFYDDLGWSPGMESAYRKQDTSHWVRGLMPQNLAKFEAGEWPNGSTLLQARKKER